MDGVGEGRGDAVTRNGLRRGSCSEEEGNVWGNGFSVIFTPRNRSCGLKAVEWERGRDRERERGSEEAEDGAERSREARRLQIVGDAIMSWWQRKVVFPVKRAWLAVSSRVIKSRKHDQNKLNKSKSQWGNT
ncbi:uncharacterized protein LOC121982458 [Zingiber officinale]|uniref:uncharacterized protein LOC121982458 n=1 Tax=Zingiber officinale TaxID=94328 RepID=UPI001C4D2450|nr:uncharacterized protein LOC121982458 [Zingiber officinale]